MASGESDYSLHFDSKSRTLRISYYGVVSEPLLISGYEAVRRFVEAHGPCRGIADFSAVDKVEISSDFVRRLASAPPAIPPGNLRVVVAPRAEIYGLSRMFQIIRDHMGGALHVVRTLRESFQILDLESPEFVQVEPEPRGSPTH